MLALLYHLVVTLVAAVVAIGLLIWGFSNGIPPMGEPWKIKSNIAARLYLIGMVLGCLAILGIVRLIW